MKEVSVVIKLTPHPLLPSGKLVPVRGVLLDLAGQEGCDDAECDALQAAAEYIGQLEEAFQALGGHLLVGGYEIK